MTEQPQSSAGSERLRVGLIADADGVWKLREALADAPLEIIAQSGMRQPEGLTGVQWFDDERVMIAQAGLRALLLATSTRAAVEIDEFVADHDLPVWRLPPLARSFPEAVELVRRTQQRQPLYRVASMWETVGEEVTNLLRSREGFRPQFSSLRLSLAGPPLHSWRSSAVDAAGGVLATDGYAALEALVAVRHLPETAAATVAPYRRKRGETPRETESVAIAILRYEGAGAAVIEATWDMPPFRQVTEHHGPEFSVFIEPERITLCGADGALLEERRLSTVSHLRRELAQFVECCTAEPGELTQERTLERHLTVTALLHAIYLSARTGQPESPRKLYEVAKWPGPRK